MRVHNWVYGDFHKLGIPLFIIHFSRIVHEIIHPAIGDPPFMETPICQRDVGINPSKLCHPNGLGLLDIIGQFGRITPHMQIR